MTLEELAALPQMNVGTEIAAKVLGLQRYSLNVAAKQGTLGIKHIMTGNRLYISKDSLLEYCGYYRNRNDQ